jgi:hypothetical protein
LLANFSRAIVEVSEGLTVSSEMCQRRQRRARPVLGELLAHRTAANDDN